VLALLLIMRIHARLKIIGERTVIPRDIVAQLDWKLPLVVRLSAVRRLHGDAARMNLLQS
jgi:hypothetical protein